jgi:hypothetical protein
MYSSLLIYLILISLTSLTLPCLFPAISYYSTAFSTYGYALYLHWCNLFRYCWLSFSFPPCLQYLYFILKVFYFKEILTGWSDSSLLTVQRGLIMMFPYKWITYFGHGLLCYFSFVFGSVEGWTQGLMHSRQVSYHLSDNCTYLLLYLVSEVGLDKFAWAGIELLVILPLIPE